MKSDKLHKIWQSQGSGTILKIDSDLLLKEIKRNKKYFETTISWRDLQELGGVFILFLFCGYFGLRHDFWQLSILLPFALLVALFIVVDRIVQKRRLLRPCESLDSYIKSSLCQVDHQIWLLKSRFWWYLLPMFIGIVIFLGYAVWVTRDLGILSFVIYGAVLLLCAFVFWHINYKGQKYIRKELKPRKQELEHLLNSLEDSSD